MKIPLRKRFKAIIGLLLVVTCLGPLLAAGCSQKEDTPPASSGYYNGPMQGKGSATKAGSPNAGGRGGVGIN